MISLLAGGGPDDETIIIMGFSKSDVEAMISGRLPEIEFDKFLAKLPDRTLVDKILLKDVRLALFVGSTDEEMARTIQQSELNQRGIDLEALTRQQKAKGETTSVAIKDVDADA